MNNYITINFGKNLKCLRKRKKLTQKELATSLGINLRQIARIEAGESFISAENFYKLCITLEVQPSELFDFNVGDSTQNNHKKIDIDDIVSNFSKQLYSRLNEY